MFVDIVEPDESNTENIPQIAVGIDFGTTNSLIAISRGKKVEIIPNSQGDKLLPSIISFNNFTIKSVKRLFGKSFEEIKQANYLSNEIKESATEQEGKLVLQIKEQAILPVQIGAEIFKKLKKQAESHLKQEVGKAVVTVPAYFDDAARAMVKDSARLAGIEVLRLIAEPTAAAYAYGLDNNSQGHYLVYDLGGGTFDVSIINISNGVFQVIATGGNSTLGGDDIDLIIAEYLQEKYNLTVDSAEQTTLLHLVKALKEKLSATEEESTLFKDSQLTLSKKELEQITTALVSHTIKITKTVLERAEIDDLEGIILVGGATKMPLIKQALKEHFTVELLDNCDPDTVVASGAALQAENLTAKSDLIIDVTPLSLGIELMGGVVEKIIPRNTPIPISVQKQYTTYADNQTGIQFHIVQGDREFVQDCRSLASFELKNIPKMPAGAVKIEVNFAVDADGLMFITAEEVTTGQKQEIQVKPTYGLSEENILEMLKAAMEHAEEDHFARLRQNSINEAQSLIYKINQALKKHGKLLSEEQAAIIKENINKVERELKTSSTEQIKLATTDLEKQIAFFVELILSSEVEGYLRGKKIEEI